MVRVGLFGVFEGEDAVIAAVLRKELSTRLPGLQLRVYTPTGADTSIGITESVEWVDQPLGACDAVRQEELASTLDAVVVSGRVEVRGRTLLVDGLREFERDVPVVWFGVSPIGHLRAAREALARHAGLWVTSQRAADELRAAGLDAHIVPHLGVGFPAVAGIAQLQPISDSLRARGSLPKGEFVGADDGVDAPAGAALPNTRDGATPIERAAAVQVSGAYFGSSETTAALAAAYGRPAFWTGEPDDAPPSAVRVSGAIEDAIDRAHGQPVVADRARLDEAFDHLAKQIETAEPEDGRPARALRIRLRDEERAAGERERALTTYNAALNNEIVSVGPRYTALWRKIHTGDRHYNWHRLRADRAEADVEKLWNIHERRVSTRLKRAIRSTRVGDAAARALGAGPLVPPPVKGGSEGPDAPTA
jgi:hypothetical protein